MAKKQSDSILGKKWPIDDLNAKDDPYEALVLAYKRGMDQLVEANTIISEVEKDDSIACVDEGRIELDDEEESNVPKTLSLKRCHDK